MQAPKLKPRFKFQGHKDTVEDVAFNPFTEMELCSVGDDKTLLFWDSRAGTAPVLKVKNNKACFNKGERSWRKWGTGHR
eukprot:219222-Pyramimonas_sp.AAC.1